MAVATTQGRGLVIEEVYRLGGRRDGLGDGGGCTAHKRGGHLEDALAALRNLVQNHPDAAFGLDFPFGLPAPLVARDTWEEFALDFRKRFPTAEAMRQACLARAGGAHLKRRTDEATAAPFSPYHPYLYRQTFHGIGGVLAPLVETGEATVLPMQSSRRGVAWVMEICPASTLKSRGLYRPPYRPYKGGDPAKAVARRRLLEAIVETGEVRLGRRDIADAVMADREGDALDSVVAAWATARAVRSGACKRPPVWPGAVEGVILV